MPDKNIFINFKKTKNEEAPDFNIPNHKYIIEQCSKIFLCGN